MDIAGMFVAAFEKRRLDGASVVGSPLARSKVDLLNRWSGLLSAKK